METGVSQTSISQLKDMFILTEEKQQEPKPKEKHYITLRDSCNRSNVALVTSEILSVREMRSKLEKIEAITYNEGLYDEEALQKYFEEIDKRDDMKIERMEDNSNWWVRAS